MTVKTILVYAWLLMSSGSHPRISSSKSVIHRLYHNNNCERSLNWTICSTTPTSPLSWLPYSFVHKYFPAAHLWPFRSLSLYTFPFVQLTHYGLQGLGEWSEKELIRQQKIGDCTRKRNKMKWFRCKKRNTKQHDMVCVFLFLPDGRKLKLQLLLHIPKRSKLLYFCNI